MKKKYLSALLWPVIVLGLASCSPDSLTVSLTITQKIPSCSSNDAQADLVCVKGQMSVVPFDSGISLKLYGADSENQEIKASFVRNMKYYGALFDRHHDYSYRTKVDEDYEDLVNVKFINDEIAALNKSPLNRASIVLPTELYEGLKIAVQFSLDSSIDEDMRYNLTVGGLSSLYDEYISEAKEIDYQMQVAKKYPQLADLRDSRYVVVHHDFDKTVFNLAKSSTLTKTELAAMFEFENSDQTLTIHKLKTYETGYTPSITLGGYGKGYAEKIFTSEYPEVALLLDGGSSSIMTQNVKTSGQNWTIRIDNPVYREEASYMLSISGLAIPLSPVNEADLYFESPEGFVLSTSGYYNNYFYTYDENDNLQLRHHIIDGGSGKSSDYFDSVSVMISDPGYADMYSTALMNCSSVDEAELLRAQLDTIYGFDTWAIYIVRDKINFDKSQVQAYVPAERKAMFHLMTADDIKDLQPLLTEFVYY